MDENESPMNTEQEAPPALDLGDAPIVATWIVRITARSRDVEPPTITDLDQRIAGGLAIEFPGIAFSARGERTDQ